MLVAIALFPARTDVHLRNIGMSCINRIFTQKSERWTWNYHPYGKPRSYPDDLDDTAHGISALSLWRPKVVDGGALAHFTKTLIQAERTPGGPYFTWLTKHASNDVDIVVNATINYTLSFAQIRLPELEAYIDTSIRRKKYISKYYPSPLINIYFLTRNYLGKEKIRLIEYTIDSIRSFTHEAPLTEYALALIILIRLFPREMPEHRQISQIISNLFDYMSVIIQKTSRTSPFIFQTYPVYAERIKNGITEMIESEAFVIAICAEATALYKTFIRTRKRSVRHLQQQDIIRTIRRKIEPLDNNLRKEFYVQLNMLKNSSAWSEIAFLPSSFDTKVSVPPTKINVRTMDVAVTVSVLGWIAYTIDDASIDRDDKYTSPSKKLSPSNIPLSRYVHRRIQHIIEHDFLKKIETGKQKLWRTFVAEIFVTIDIAQFKEARLGEKQLSSRDAVGKSIGHILGTMIGFYAQGHIQTPHDPLARTLRQSFIHHIYSRQLSDDAHDWHEDMQAGRTTEVTKLIQKHNPHGYTDEKQLRTIFWNHCAEKIAKKITHHAKMARNLLKTKAFADLDTEFFDSCIARYENIGITMQKEIAQTKSFIAAY